MQICAKFKEKTNGQAAIKKKNLANIIHELANESEAIVWQLCD